jgi:predicted RND superfamily exporter protein
MTPVVFERVLVAAFRRPGVVLSVAALAGVVAIASLVRVRFDSNVLHLLPQRSPAVRTFQTFLDAFGNLDRLYVMFVVPSDRVVADDEAAIDTYIDRLRALPEIESVDAGRNDPGKDWGYLADRQLLLLGREGLDDALRRLDPARYETELAEARAQLALPSADIKTLVTQDPLRLLPLLRNRLARGGMLLPFDPTEPGYVSDDHRSRLVIAKPTRPPFDTAFAKSLNAKLDALAASARAASGAGGTASDRHSPVDVKEAGGYRAAAQAEAVIKRESVISTISSLVVIVLLVLAVFRSARPLAAVFLPILLAAVVTIATYGAWRPISSAVAGSAAMLLGLGVDGTLLLYIMYIQRRRDGLEPERAVAGLAPFAASVSIGFVTTAATYFGVVPVDQPALAELGWSVGLGVIVCGAVAVLMVPALVPRGPEAPSTRDFRSPTVARLVGRGRVPILIVAALLTVVSAVASSRLRLVLTVDRLEPAIPAVAVEKEIARRFHLPEDTLFVLAQGDSLDRLLELHERLLADLKAAGDLSVESPALLLPSERSQGEMIARVASAGLTANRVRDALADASRKVGFREDSFQPFLARLPALVASDQRLTLDGYLTHGLGDLLSRFVTTRSGMVTTVAYVSARSPEDIDRVERVVRAIGPPLRLTGIALVNRELEQRFRPDFLTGAALGVAGVALLLAIGFGRLRLVPLALLPTALGLLWTVGIVSLAGVALDLFSAFALLVSIGIGVDYAVHVLYRRQTRPEGGMLGAIADVTPALVLAAATAIIGFGSLATSSYAPLRLFGLVSALAIGSCLIASIIVLPALIRDPQ